MAILTDGTHLVSDTSATELHEFARKLKMPMAWFQFSRFPHYDILSDRLLRRALALGAEEVDIRTLVRRAVKSGETQSAAR